MSCKKFANFDFKNFLLTLAGAVCPIANWVITIFKDNSCFAMINAIFR